MASRIKEAINIIKNNDRGGYTVPTNRLYPYQWNWDSGFTALGIWHFNKWRAWLEITSLLDAQWEDGMVPHIVFRRNDPDYFPGPDVWKTNTEPPTSGHSQPPVLASIVLQMVRMGSNYDKKKAKQIFSRLMSYHRWFATNRDPLGTGIIGIIHPWESGRDNCPDWDIGLKSVEVPDDLMRYQRRDTSHVDVNQRPTQEQYDKFIAIVEFGQKAGWNHKLIHNDGPFLMADPGVQFIFLRANKDLFELAQLLDFTDELNEIKDWIELLNKGMTHHCNRILSACSYGMPSWDPQHEEFESKRYWRGPVWLVMNHMIAIGLQDSGESSLAERVRNDTYRLVENNGMAEYFDPLDGTGLGGMNFSWTAAIYLNQCNDEVANTLDTTQ